RCRRLEGCANSDLVSAALSASRTDAICAPCGKQREICGNAIALDSVREEDNAHAQSSLRVRVLDDQSRRATDLACSSCSSAMVSGLRVGARAPVNTPSAQSMAVRPSLSFTSSKAPFSARYAMMSFEPRLAAP